MLQKFADNFMWILMFVLLVNISQRKLDHSEKKRFATIYIAALLLIYNVLIIIVLTKELPTYLGYVALIVPISLGIIFRDRVWPFRLHCKKCGVKMKYERVIGGDENLCESCWLEEHPEEAEKKRQKEEEKLLKEQENNTFVCPDSVDEIDWDAWDPEERCVLAYVKEGDKVLLINKKQGIGKGLINGPGGHIELEETAIEAAYREFEEETGYTAENLEYVGTLNFQFKDGLSMRGYVYLGEGAKGELRDNDEATPFWCPINELPLDKMWEDDKLWLDRALKGEKFVGNFIFDGEKMLSHDVVFE
ncbi:MAG: 8-oxo-dGTP diphosphatase [Sphaerochaetaceae bacterium]|nr:8-oxo-dGTP diphosphatase [Sphaerochaetaceae bacterium]MDC7249348.1 8-oxo-dGTP diphosphatase [Sphaerochaetaceae bacterium]